MVKREYSYGTSDFNSRIHIVIDVDFYHGPLCKVGKHGNPDFMNTKRDPELSINDVNCAACNRTVTYSRLKAGLQD